MRSFISLAHEILLAICHAIFPVTTTSSTLDAISLIAPIPFPHLARSRGVRSSNYWDFTCSIVSALVRVLYFFDGASAVDEIVEHFYFFFLLIFLVLFSEMFCASQHSHNNKTEYRGIQTVSCLLSLPSR